MIPMYEKTIKNLYEWLLKLQVKEKGYDHGGIYDPIDKRVFGEHYSATHFALLSAVLFRMTNDLKYLNSARLAIDFHIRTSKDEYKYGDWAYHWEFNNYAFLETYNLLYGSLSSEEREEWETSIRSWKSTGNHVTNWLAMNAYSYLLRYRLFGSLPDYLRYRKDLFHVKRAQLNDGCFEDVKGESNPIQYHVFTLAILHRIFQVTKNNDLKNRFLRGVDYFKYFVDPDGDFNFKGRGQEQIFGYGAAIYILEAAKNLDSKNRGEYRYLSKKVYGYLLEFVNEEGYFPLVLNEYNDSEKMGWYDYHHLTVYNAFLGAWLAMSSMILENDTATEQKIYDAVKLFKPSETLIVRSPSYYAVFSGGGTGYLSDSGLSPHHIWVKGAGWFLPSAGGPSPGRFGKINRVEHVEKNFFAPIAKDSKGFWVTPALKKGIITEIDSENYMISLNYGHFDVKRRISFGLDKISFEDRVHFKKDGEFQEFRYFNMPVSTEKYKMDIHDNRVEFRPKQGGTTVVLDITNSHDIEILEKIKTSRGYVTILCKRDLQQRFKKGEIKETYVNLRFLA